MSNKDRLLSILRKMADEMLVTNEDLSVYVHYDTWQEFGKKIHELCTQLDNGSFKAKQELTLIFLPTSDWDESGGLTGYDPDELLKLLKKI